MITNSSGRHFAQQAGPAKAAFPVHRRILLSKQRSHLPVPVFCLHEHKQASFTGSTGSSESQRPRAFDRRSLLLSGATSLLCTPESQAGSDQDRSASDLLDAEEVEFGLRVVSLRGSVPQEWPVHWRQVLAGRTRLQLERRAQVADIFDDLALNGRTGKAAGKAAATADVVTLGDAWLGPAIQQGLIQPIPDALSARWWKALGPRWRSLVRRDEAGWPASRGQVWAAPYRWGCTLIAVHAQQLRRRTGHAIRDWKDLLQPSLQGRLAFVDAPREFAAVALRMLGASFNSSIDELRQRGITTQQLRQQLDQLRAQVRLFSSQEHTHALLAGDVTAVVGWSGDLLPLASRSSNIVLVAPLSGTMLHADLWCCPASAQPGGSEAAHTSPLLPVWLDFCLQPQRTAAHRGLQQGAPPRLLPDSGAFPEVDWQQNLVESPSGALVGGFLPPAGVLARSDFLLPQRQETAEVMWQALHPFWNDTAV